MFLRRSPPSRRHVCAELLPAALPAATGVSLPTPALLLCRIRFAGSRIKLRLGVYVVVLWALRAHVDLDYGRILHGG